jgi:3-polyprenyl-4-hydroxybenzoate decarboxylase
MNVTAIAHRRNPVFQAFLSQFPPSESSMIRGVGREGVLLKTLRVDQGMDNILGVAMHEPTGSWGLTVIQLKEPQPGQVERIWAAITPRMRSKWMVVVDDDIDPRDADSVNWALAFRWQPARHTQIVPMPEMNLDPSIADPAEEDSRNPLDQGETRSSAMLIDATRKWPYPPTSLPTRPHMEHALAIWQEEGLPELQLKTPWFGVNLGYWPEERVEEARLAVEGRYYETGQKFEGMRVKVDQEGNVG